MNKLTCIGFLLLPVLASAASLRPAELRCEYRVNPLGIDVVQPRLSWVLEATDPKAHNLKQSAYHIVVTSGANTLWDTGKVVSDQSIQIVYRGKPLKSGMPVSWKVQVWDQAGQPSEWSEAARWSMGLLRYQDWKAAWIGRDQKPDTTSLNPPPLPARMLRKEFDIGKQPKRATLYFSGLGLSEVYLNGNKVGDAVLSPGLTDYDKRVLYVTYDVTKLLNTGRNAMGVWLGNGRYYAPRGSTRPERALSGIPRHCCSSTWSMRTAARPAW